MDYSELLREIVARVLEQLNTEQQPAKRGPSIIVAAPEHSERCREIMESAALSAEYDMVCAKSQNFECSLSGCRALVVGGLKNHDVSKIAAGICDTPFTALIEKALLEGLPVYALREETEILSIAPKTPYAAMLRAKLRAVEGFGVCFCKADEIEGKILSMGMKKAGLSADERRGKNEVITERDVKDALEQNRKVILTGERPIITDLAKELAREKGIEFRKK